MSVLELLSWIGIALAGTVGHEIAHYLVWQVTGREPRLHLWKLTVTPHAGPPDATTGDRVSAAAPYLVGAAALLWALLASAPLWGIFGLGMFQIPSRADVDTMRGRVRWVSLAP